MNWFDAAYRWCVWASDCDGGSGTADWRKASLSATKVCGYACVATGLLVIALTREISAAANCLIAMGITALFGRSMWKNWLSRNTWTTSTSDVRQSIDARIAVETTEIVDRRADRDYEVTL